MWKYKLTTGADLNQRSAISLVARGGESMPPVGVYEDGLLTVLDEKASEGFLRSWSWLVGDGSMALMTTGTGDVFFWAADRVNWLNVQRATVEPVDPELSWFVDEFLVKEGVVEKALRRSRLKELVVSLRPLRYLECFILKPWLILGGVDDVNHYEIGHCGVYVDLVGQTYMQVGTE